VPQNIQDAVDKAKSTLADANKKFPSISTAPKAQTPVAKAAAQPSTGLGDSTIGPSLKAKQQNIQDYSNSLPKMHTGGDVPKTGDYKLQKGEHVSPARSSEYRKVFEQRGAAGKHKWGGQPSHPQSNENGGNSPAPKGEEKHDEPKAKKGIKDNVNS
jgi:hypothetical protein